MRKGQRVKYIPHHAGGNPSHKDCETGVVSSLCHNPDEDRSVDEEYVFVKYDNAGCFMKTGNEDCTAQRTAVAQLVPL